MKAPLVWLFDAGGRPGALAHLCQDTGKHWSRLCDPAGGRFGYPALSASPDRPRCTRCVRAAAKHIKPPVARLEPEFSAASSADVGGDATD